MPSLLAGEIPLICLPSGKQGVDLILRSAWEKRIILAGGSAGSLCWFEQGTTDSRPANISKIECLGFIRAVIVRIMIQSQREGHCIILTLKQKNLRVSLSGKELPLHKDVPLGLDLNGKILSTIRIVPPGLNSLPKSKLNPDCY